MPCALSPVSGALVECHGWYTQNQSHSLAIISSANDVRAKLRSLEFGSNCPAQAKAEGRNAFAVHCWRALDKKLADYLHSARQKTDSDVPPSGSPVTNTRQDWHVKRAPLLPRAPLTVHGEVTESTVEVEHSAAILKKAITHHQAQARQRTRNVQIQREIQACIQRCY
ncbi:Uncharacterised protein [Vibrio cholerae]|uniref:Uncharacterized protein n=1 Tax=Vibrio cholerae TaxID=666 RepID=A0A655W3R8_VIBCL|nr:Uncharacterised protein [Vibrio cholerae]